MFRFRDLLFSVFLLLVLLPVSSCSNSQEIPEPPADDDDTSGGDDDDSAVGDDDDSTAGDDDDSSLGDDDDPDLQDPWGTRGNTPIMQRRVPGRF